MNPFEIAIWFVLAILGYITAHTVIERLLFHAGCRIARRKELEQFCGQLCEFRSLSFTQPLVNRWHNGGRSFLRPEPLGWLAPLVVEANGMRATLRQLLDDFESIPNRFSSFQATMVNVGASLGMMGTVLAFYLMSGSQNFAKLFPLAFGTSLAGLFISIPACLIYGLLTPRVDQILDQIDLVRDAIEASEKPDDTCSLQEVTSVLREELTQMAAILQAIAQSQEVAISQQKELLASLRYFVHPEGVIDKTDSIDLVSAGGRGNGKSPRTNGRARHLSKGMSNDTETR